MMSPGRTRVVVLFVAFAFLVVSVRTELQARQIRAAQAQIAQNQARIVRLQFEQCAARNVATARQNTLLDSAIAAERRRPVPDLRRVRDLTDFKAALLNCGPSPAGVPASVG